MTLWWLSFCDGDRPLGTQFLGVAIVEGATIAIAASNAWRLGVNPGGEILGIMIPAEKLGAVASVCNRLLSRHDLVVAGLEPVTMPDATDGLSCVMCDAT